jgi:diguanylate cyclase
MTPILNANPVSVSKVAPAKSLTKVLDHSERVQDMVAECAVELSAVNGALKQELAIEHLPSAVEIALEKSEAIESKVQVASDELTVVNEALQDEIGARQGLQTQLAEVIEQKDAALHAAFHDSLTSLPNRALFHDRLEHALIQAARHGWQLAVLFIDLDKFKMVNDTLGHASGDELLQAIASGLKNAVRADDTISRYGGDEFLVLLTHMSDKQMVKRIADKMANAIQSASVANPDNAGENIHIGASIGIALYPTDGLTADVLIDAADKAMYRVKQDQSIVGFSIT